MQGTFQVIVARFISVRSCRTLSKRRESGQAVWTQERKLEAKGHFPAAALCSSGCKSHGNPQSLGDKKATSTCGREGRAWVCNKEVLTASLLSFHTFPWAWERAGFFQTYPVSFLTFPCLVPSPYQISFLDFQGLLPAPNLITSLECPKLISSPLNGSHLGSLPMQVVKGVLPPSLPNSFNRWEDAVFSLE